MTIRRSGLALACLLSAAACTPKASAPPTAVAVAPAPVALPRGAGCGPAISRTQAVVESDVATGNLNQPVGEKFQTDLRAAAVACAAGRDREAAGLLAAAKARYGYP